MPSTCYLKEGNSFTRFKMVLTSREQFNQGDYFDRKGKYRRLMIHSVNTLHCVEIAL